MSEKSDKEDSPIKNAPPVLSDDDDEEEEDVNIEAELAQQLKAKKEEAAVSTTPSVITD